MTPQLRSLAWIVAILTLGCLAYLAISPASPRRPAPTSASATPTPSRYAGYDFDDASGTTVGFATQPLWVPTSTITELMRRDAVLAEDIAKIGLKLTFFPFHTGADINSYLLSGKLAAGVGGDMPALAAAAQSEVVVASLVNQGFISIIAKRRMQLSELRGKTLGCVTGSSAHFAMLRALDVAGVRQNEVAIEFLSIADMPQALRLGRIDAYSAWEPHSTVQRNANPDFTVIHRIGYSGYLYFNGRFAGDRPEAAKALIAAQLRAMAFMKAKRENLLVACRLALDEARRFTGSDPGISADEYAALVKSEFLDFVPVPIIPENATADAGQLSQAFAFLKDHVGLPAGANWSEAKTRFDRSLIREVVASPGAFRLGEFAYLDLTK